MKKKIGANDAFDEVSTFLTRDEPILEDRDVQAISGGEAER